MSDLAVEASEDELTTQAKAISNQLAIGRLLLSRLTPVAKRIQDTQKSLVTMAASRAKKEELKQEQEAKKTKQEADGQETSGSPLPALHLGVRRGCAQRSQDCARNQAV